MRRRPLLQEPQAAALFLFATFTHPSLALITRVLDGATARVENSQVPRNDLKAALRTELPRAIAQLQSQGMARPGFRSCWYLLLDWGVLHGDSSHGNLNHLLSLARDDGSFPYGVLAPDGGESNRGLTSRELEAYLKQVQADNIEPVLVDGILKAVLIEKHGLLDYLRGVLPEIPVASPTGQLRKEWATEWASDLEDLAAQLGATEIEITYLGDLDTWGDVIKRVNINWWMSQHGIPVDVYAVHPRQAASLGYPTLHIDGFISLTGPRAFAQHLRRRLGLARETNS